MQNSIDFEDDDFELAEFSMEEILDIEREIGLGECVVVTEIVKECVELSREL